MSVSQRSYQEITDRLVQLLEQGTVPWRKPWNSGEPVQNLTTRRPYRGINPFILNCQPFGSPFWISYRQAQGLGGHVRRGEKGTPIWFWKWYDKEQPDGEQKRIPVLRRYTVFNVAQCDGLEDHVPALTDPDRQPFSPIERCER